MYLNLLYNGKKFLYEANNKLNIGHLKEISEKILNSDKNLMHIIYNNNKYIFPNDKTYLKDLIPKGQKRAAFSIKVDEKYMTNNDDYKNDNNSKTPVSNRKSFDEVIKENSIKRNIFKNFSNIWSSQKKFITTITYKYNEFLIEIREFNRRINEVYEELFKSYTQSNINYNNYLSESNCNDVNDKLTEISNYEHQMIKFIEKEKYYFKKLNILIKKCLLMQNNKIIVSNKNLQELYEKMFDENFRNEGFKFNIEETDYNSEFKNKKLNVTQKSSIIENQNNLTKKALSFEDSYLNKTIKMNKKKKLPLLSYENNNFGNKEIIGTKDKKMIISTELGQDGIQRGKITLFNEEKKKPPILKIKKSSNDNDNGMIKEETEEEGKNSGGIKKKENEENNPTINTIIKNRLIYRNKKTKDYNVHFNSKDGGMKNKSLIRNISSERPTSGKDKINNIKIKKIQNTIELNNNLEVINTNKNIFNKKSNKNIQSLNHYDKANLNDLNNNKKDDKKYNKIKLNLDKDKDNDDNQVINNNIIDKKKNASSKSIKKVKNKSSKSIKEIKYELSKSLKDAKNKSSKSIKSIKNKENNENNEQKEKDKKRKKEKESNGNNVNEISNSVIKSNISDSSELVKNKNNSSQNISIKNESSNVLPNINSSKGNTDKKGQNISSINKKYSSKDKHSIKSESSDKTKDIDKKASKRRKRNSKESEDEVDEEEEEDNLKYDKIHDNSIREDKSKNKKKKKKRRFSSKDDDSEESDKENVNNTDKKANNQIKIKKNFDKDVISEESNDSDESKKKEDNNYYKDINLLRSLLIDKDNPYNKNRFDNPYNRRNNIFKKADEIPAASPESDEEEKKKINLFKRKKKKLTNKYDFII